MKKQTQVQPVEEHQAPVKPELAQQIKEAVAEKVTHPQYRDVKLIYRSCCGCGCDDVAVRRRVPWDSALKDGQRIEELKPGDKRWNS